MIIFVYPISVFLGRQTAQKGNKFRGTQTTKLRGDGEDRGEEERSNTATRLAETEMAGSASRNQTLTTLQMNQAACLEKTSAQCKTYNTHKSGKPENSESQKKMLPSILFLRIDGILPTAINGIWMSCVEKERFQAISPTHRRRSYLLPVP